MTKLLRILGKRGRVTIPQEIRQRVGFAYNDVLSFAEQDDRTVVIKREKLCDDCCDNLKSTDKSTNDKALLQFLDNSFGFDKTVLREKLFKCITEKYAQIDDTPYVSRRLKSDFEKSSPLSSFSADLCTRTVKSIRLGTDGTVSITLINGQNIGKEQAV